MAPVLLTIDGGGRTLVIPTDQAAHLVNLLSFA